eukprot:7381968-Prymnesium_polylepis.1
MVHDRAHASTRRQLDLMRARGNTAVLVLFALVALPLAAKETPDAPKLDAPRPGRRALKRGGSL